MIGDVKMSSSSGFRRGVPLLLLEGVGITFLGSVTVYMQVLTFYKSSVFIFVREYSRYPTIRDLEVMHCGT